MKTIIHICNDEKFIESAKYLFNKSGFGNSYYVIVKDENVNLKHIIKDEKTQLVTSQELAELSKKIKSNSIIILHSLIVPFYDFILNVKGRCKLIWMVFGMEIYSDSNLYQKKELYELYTRAIIPKGKKRAFKKIIKDELRPYVRHFKPNLPYSLKEQKRKVFKAIGYIGIAYKEEYNKIIQVGNLKDARYFFFTYYPIENIVAIKKTINNKKDKLMIGNSAHVSNNHIDVFNKIKNYNLGGKKLFLPLSYGNNLYKGKVIKVAEDTFSNDKIFLVDFLKLRDYDRILEDVQIFVLYTKRQQGIGNVIALIWHGAKVFLSKHNTFYHYLKRIGINVLCYESELDEKTIKSGLSTSEIEHNRNVLYEHFNTKIIIHKLQKQLNQI